MNKEKIGASRRDLLIAAGGIATALTLPAAAAAASSPLVVAAADGSPSVGVTKTIAVADGTKIFYKDWGMGRPVVFSHGWPLTADAWDAQMLFLGMNGYRVIAHDRRSHGRSDQTWTGNDMDTYADDLAALLDALGERRDARRPFDRWWRSRSLHWATRNRARVEGRTHRCRSAPNAEDRK